MLKYRFSKMMLRADFAQLTWPKKSKKQNKIKLCLNPEVCILFWREFSPKTTASIKNYKQRFNN